MYHRYRTLAHLQHLPSNIDVVFFGGEGSHLLLHALHVALAEFDDAGCCSLPRHQQNTCVLNIALA